MRKAMRRRRNLSADLCDVSTHILCPKKVFPDGLLPSKRLAARQDQLPLQLARDTELEQVLVIELEEKAAINSGVGKGADMHVQTEVPKPLAHRVLIPGVC